MIAAAPNGSKISDSVRDELEKSFAGAQEVARQYPQYASKITAAAKSAFLSGDQWAYLAGIVAVLLGAVIVFFLFPGKRREKELLAGYESEDEHRAPVPSQRAADHQKLGQHWLLVETSS